MKTVNVQSLSIFQYIRKERRGKRTQSATVYFFVLQAPSVPSLFCIHAPTRQVSHFALASPFSPLAILFARLTNNKKYEKMGDFEQPTLKMSPRPWLGVRVCGLLLLFFRKQAVQGKKRRFNLLLKVRLIASPKIRSRNKSLQV